MERLDFTGEKEFIKLYKDLYSPLMSYGMRICSSEELVRDGIHEIFLEFWEKSEKFSTIKEIKPYLFRCLRNILIDYLKKHRPLLRDDSGELSDLNIALSQNEHFSLSQEDIIIEKEVAKESRELIGNYINKLSERQREVFYLKFYDGLSNLEIAEITGIHYQSVRNIISEGIKRIRDSNLERHIFSLSLILWIYI